MAPRWISTLVKAQNVNRLKNSLLSRHQFGFSRVIEVQLSPASKIYASSSEAELDQLVNLREMFCTKPISLALPYGSPQRINDPDYKANVIYSRVVSQAENPVVYDVFRLEKTFRTTFSMLIVHMWLCLRRLKIEGEEGVELGQYLYEIFDHDLEIRVSKAGVDLLFFKWMRELEKIFYGNVVAYETAMLLEAEEDELHNVIWKNVFSDDGSPTFDAAALPVVLAFSRYVRRECSCLSLTDKESMFTGNFVFTTIYNPNTRR